MFFVFLHPCCVPDLREDNFSFLLQHAINCGFAVWKSAPSRPNCFRFLNHKHHWILVNACYISVWMLMWFLSSVLLMWLIMFIDFCVSHACTCGINITWYPLWEVISLLLVWDLGIWLRSSGLWGKCLTLWEITIDL